MAGTHTKPAAEFLTGIRDHFVETLKQEHANTQKVLQQVRPGDWRPDPKSRTAAELSWHIVHSEIWFLESVASGKFVGGEEGARPQHAEVITYYEQRFPKHMARISQLSAEQLGAIVDFYGMKLPLYAYLDICLRHSIHHRGQLCAYLRALGGKVPDIYGGSADEPWQGQATN